MQYAIADAQRLEARVAFRMRHTLNEKRKFIEIKLKHKQRNII